MDSRKDVLKPLKEKQNFMNDRIASSIEANRKGFAFLELVDEKGEAVKDAEIKVTQKNHDFKYGANLFMLDEFAEAEKNEKYKLLFAEVI